MSPTLKAASSLSPSSPRCFDMADSAFIFSREGLSWVRVTLLRSRGSGQGDQGRPVRFESLL